MSAQPPLVLIVDDAPANIQTLASYLSDSYRIKVAHNGQRCLELIEQSELPDVILLDIEMPGIDGYEVCRALHYQPRTRDIPIIFVTGREDDDNEAYGLSLGAVDYITKPVRPAIVKARINTHITLKKQRDKLAYLALHDQLTGLYNRHFLMEAAHKKIALALRQKQSLSFLMIDIDYFKLINDHHSHSIGDQVLIDIGQLLAAQVREEDIAARMGGEEFVIVFNQCSLADAYQKAETIRQQVAERNPQDLRVTVSIGVTQLSERAPTLDSLIQQADDALYQAKEKGRNRVEVFDQIELSEGSTEGKAV
ncbi:MAG: diguanylate cyclase [Pontibacterium sp.]